MSAKSKKSNLLKKIVVKQSFILVFLGIFPLLIGLGLFYLALSGGYIDLLFNRIPTLSSVQEINDLDQDNKALRAMVKLQTKELMDADYYVETTTMEDGKVVKKEATSFFLFAEVEDGLIVVEFPYYQMKYIEQGSFIWSNALLTGRIVTPDGGGGIIPHVKNTVKDMTGQSVEDLYPNGISIYVLDTVASGGPLVFVGGAIVFFILALIPILRSIFFVFGYRKSRLYRSLAAFGDPQKVEQEIQSSYENLDTSMIVGFGNQFIFDNYIVCTQPASVRRTADLRWIYVHLMLVQGVKQHVLMLYFAKGIPKAGIRVGNPKKLKQAIQTISSRLPVLVGHSSDLKKMYTKNYEAFHALWEERKKEFEKSQN